jgi:ketosteroid isomerase-like protein
LTRVVQHGKGRTSGTEGDDRYYILYTFRGRRIVRIEVIRGRTEALEAVGLLKEAPSRGNVEKMRQSLDAFDRRDRVAWLALRDPT